MPLSLRDFEDANLAGLTIFERWRAEFEAQFIQADAEEMIAQLLQQLTPEQKLMMQQSNPEAFKSLTERLKVR